MTICDQCHQPRPKGSWPICDDGSGKHGHEYSRGGNRISTIHTSERAVVYMNPRTGEHRTPPRADQPMPEVYRRQGFERVEMDTHQKLREFEKKTGLVQESRHFDNGSGGAERSLNTGIGDGPNIKGLDRAYGDRELLTAADLPLHLRD